MIDIASYCLNCKMKPCSVRGCPLNNDIPAFIREVKKENLERAFEILSESTVLPAVCGRICPHFKQCQGSCVRGIKGDPVNIGDLEAFVGDYGIKNGLKFSMEDSSVNGKVAVVGGGPAGLTCSAYLARKGVKVTIFERYDFLGGLLMYGIPEFRLSKDIVLNTINKIIDLGVEVRYNQKLGDNLSLDYLTKNYDYVFLAFGANVSSKMGIDGENLEGVYGGNELLEHNLHPDYKNKTVIVNGGGNVAIDTARTIKRLGAKKVIITYRRAKEQMPAEKKEVEDAKKEGIEFLFQNNIIKIIGNKKVEKVELVKTKLIQKEGDTRLSPVDIKNSNYELKADYVVMAIGSKTDELVKKLNLDLTKYNYIKVDENHKTSNPKVFAGGDLAGDKSTVAWAAKAGRDVANLIYKQL